MEDANSEKSVNEENGEVSEDQSQNKHGRHKKKKHKHSRPAVQTLTNTEPETAGFF